MMLSKLQELQVEFRNMEKTGKVKKEVVNDIDETKEEILEIGKKILSKLEKVDRFKAFFTIKTHLSILDSMKKRVEESELGNDNPGVAEDSLSMLDTMQKFSKMTERDIKDYRFSELLKLQKEAKKLSFFPSSSELKRQFSQDEIESANRFFDNLRNEMRH